MPFALVTIGLILIITGFKNTYGALGSQLKADFTGPGNFTWWLASLGAIGALGYVDEFKAFSRWFMTLIIVSMFLANRGFFNQLTAALKQGPVSPVAAAPTGGSASNDTSGDAASTALDVGKAAVQVAIMAA